MVFSRIGVVGGGIMGSGIAEACALAGSSVHVCESSTQRAEECQARIDLSMQRRAEAGSRTPAPRVHVGADLEALAGCDLIIEAAPEDESIKIELFRRLSKIVKGTDAVLASNTSSIPIMKLAMATDRADRVIGLHFFNPVRRLRLVELVPSLLTSDATTSRVACFAQDQLGKRVIRSADRAGFVVNALLIPYLLSAVRMLESGFATAADIDAGMVEGAAHPLGPLALIDLIGLDTTRAVAQSLYAEFGEPLYSPPPLLCRMADAGLLGRKSGRGFFDYATEAG